MPGSRIAPVMRGEARLRRQAMQGPEKRLWRGLRRLNRNAGCHFRRQAPVGRAIADFAELGRRLAVLVEDDCTEPGSVATLEAWFVSQGFRVLRVPRMRLMRAPEAVLGEIARAAGVAPPPSPSPTRGEGSTDGAARPSPPPRGEGLGVGGGPGRDGRPDHSRPLSPDGDDP